MRKFYSFLMLMGLASGFFASAQNTPTKKVAQIKTQNVYQDDDGSNKATDKTLEYYYYDREGNMLANAIYNLPSHTIYSNKEYVYDNQNRLVTYLLSYSGRLNEKHTYVYGDGGQLSKESIYSMLSGEILTKTIEYEYNDQNLMQVATHYNDQGKALQKYVYGYDGNGCKSYEEFYSTNEGNLYLAQKTDYTYNKDGQLLKDSLTTISVTGDKTPKSATHYEYQEGKLVADYVYSYHSSQEEPRSGESHLYAQATNNLVYKHVYEYDADGDLTKKTEQNWLSEASGYVDNKYYIYATGIYCKDYVVTNLKVEAGQETATVKVSFDEPAVTQGLEGYKVMVDGVVRDEVYPAGQTSFVVNKQAKGTHLYKILGVYDGVVSNVSDGKELTVDVICPAPTNLQATAYEWDALFSKWKVTLAWDAPQASGLTLKNYRTTHNDINGGTTANNTLVVQHYGKEDAVSFKVYAVYEEGESEPVEIALDLSDTSKQLTQHWNNSGYETKDYNGQLLGSGVYYYSSNTSSEKLMCEVKYDASKNPVQKITHEMDYGTPLSDTYYAWDAATWQWINDTTVVYGRNQYDVLSSVITKTLDPATGKLVNSLKEEYMYSEEDPYGDPVKTNYYELADGQLALTSVVKHQYNKVDYQLVSQTNTRYDAAEQHVIGKEVIDYVYEKDIVTQETHTLYDNTGEKITGKTVYEYVKSEIPGTVTTYRYEDTEFIPESKTVWEYSPQTNLVVSEKRTVYHDAQWIDENTTLYTASPAYHSTHTATKVIVEDAVDGNPYYLTWTAPTRTDGMIGYRIFGNEVELTSELLSKDALTYNLPDRFMKAGFYRFNVMAVYEEGESCLSDIATLKVDPVDFATIKEMKEAGVGLAGYKVKGEVLVLGSADVEGVTSWFVEDESAALRVVMPEGMVFPFVKGNKIKNITGVLDKNGNAYTFTFESAKLVSEVNPVVQTIKTIADINANLAGNEGRYVKIDEADCNVTGDLLPERFETTQDGVSIDLYIGSQEIENPKGKIIYSGFVCLEGEKPFIVLSGNFVNGISTLATTENRIYYSDGKIMAEGALAIEVYDVAGRKLVASQNEEVNVNGMKGTLVVKAVYANKEVKIMKLAVK